MPTIGGSEIVVHGSSLGTNNSVVSLMYAGGMFGFPQHNYTALNCRIRALNTEIACTSVPGVGGNYSFQVVVDGGSSAWSTARVSYAAPTISLLTGLGAFHGPVKVMLHCRPAFS